jgi:hypothetical protein
MCFTAFSGILRDQPLGDHPWGPPLGTTIVDHPLDHPWGPPLGTTFGVHLWGPPLGTTLGDQPPFLGTTFGDHHRGPPHPWGPHPPPLGTILGDHHWEPLLGTTPGDHPWNLVDHHWGSPLGTVRRSALNPKPRRANTWAAIKILTRCDLQPFPDSLWTNPWGTTLGDHHLEPLLGTTIGDHPWGPPVGLY